MMIVFLLGALSAFLAVLFGVLGLTVLAALCLTVWIVCAILVVVAWNN